MVQPKNNLNAMVEISYLTNRSGSATGASTFTGSGSGSGSGSAFGGDGGCASCTSGGFLYSIAKTSWGEAILPSTACNGNQICVSNTLHSKGEQTSQNYAFRIEVGANQ